MDRDDQPLNELVFDESQIGDLQKIGQQLFSRGAVPGEPGYQRVLKRPEINWIQIVLQCAIPPLMAMGLYLLLWQFRFPAPWQALIPVGLLLLWGGIRIKHCAICLVKIYQHFAPDAIRNKCRFEPSCSEYMILSLEKYGFVKGIGKGIGRLRRCNIDHGGYDAP